MEARLSSSCPSLNVDSEEEAAEGVAHSSGRRRSRQNIAKDHKGHRKRSERKRR